MLFCSQCNLTFKTKKGLTAHFDTKKHLNSNKENKYKCGCGKSYSYRQGLHTHKKTCKYHLTTENEAEFDEPEVHSTPIEKQLEDLKTAIEEERHRYEEERRRHDEEREELRDEIKILLEKIGENTKITNNTNNTNSHNVNIDTQNNNVTININAFGNENLDYITDKVIVKCIGRVYSSIPVLIEKIHFDPKHPENHNIKITNRKLPYASVMTENNKWKTIDKNDAIDKMVVQGYDLLDIKYDDNKNNIQPYIQDRFKEFQSKYGNQDKNTLKPIKKQIELSILNAKTK